MLGDAPIGLAPANFQEGPDSEYEGGPGDFVGGPAPHEGEGLLGSGPNQPALDNAARVSNTEVKDI